MLAGVDVGEEALAPGGADLTGADLSGAKLADSEFRKATLDRAKFAGADLAGGGLFLTGYALGYGDYRLRKNGRDQSVP